MKYWNELARQCVRVSVVLIGVRVLVGAEPPDQPAAKDGNTSSGVFQTEPDGVQYAKDHFGEQGFVPEGGFVLRQGRRLPRLVWENKELIAAVLDNPAIPTRWFDESFEEVTAARKPGRYYVYGEAPAPHGQPLRRAMTCLCVRKDEDLALLAEKLIPAIRKEPDPTRKHALVAQAVNDWITSETGVVTLAALLDAGPNSKPVRAGQWLMDNATRHVQLKRKLMGLGDVPPVRVAPRPFKGGPAPTLRHGPLENPELTADLVEDIERRLSDWYADARKPMAIVIAHRGAVAVAKGYGELDGRPVTINTPMLLYSAMKPILGIQLAMYADRGIVSLDQPLGTCLPDFDSPSDSNLTFRAAHVHATGIQFPWSLMLKHEFYFQTWYESLIAHCPRDWAPGAGRQYGVVGIMMSCRALELKSGMNYWEALERELFEPLGIRDMLPGGTGFSAEDLARIGILLDNHGKYGELELFSEETYRSILPTPLKPYFPALDMEYGIGLRESEALTGPGWYGHYGGSGSLIAVNPEKHLVFALVRNEHDERYDTHMKDALAQLNAWPGE